MKRSFFPIVLLASSPAMAEDASSALPDMVGVENYTDDGEVDSAGPWSSRSIDWRVDANGNAVLVVIGCPPCHLPRRRRHEFTIGADVYARIAALLPRDQVEAALNARCTLPHARAAFNHRIELVRRSGNIEDTRDLFEQCSSPELDDLKRRIAQATTIVLAAEPALEDRKED